MISVSSAFTTFACHSQGRSSKRRRVTTSTRTSEDANTDFGNDSERKQMQDKDACNARSTVLNNVLVRDKYNRENAAFVDLRYCTKDHLRTWFEEYVGTSMPQDTEFRAACIVTDLLRYEDADPTYSGWRVWPVVPVPTTTKKQTEAERMFAHWVRQCTRVSSAMLRIAPLACFCLSPYPRWLTRNPDDRRRAIAEWASLFGFEEMLRWVDVMADLVQHVVSETVHDATGLPIGICHIIAPMYVCTCNAGGRSLPCHCASDFDFQRKG